MWRGGWRRWPRGAVVLLLVAAGCWWVRVEARSIPVPRAVLVDPAREVSGTIEYVAGGGVLGVWIYPERAGERVPRVGLTLRSGGAVVPAEVGGSSSSRDLAAQYWPPVGPVRLTWTVDPGDAGAGRFYVDMTTAADSVRRAWVRMIGLVAGILGWICVLGGGVVVVRWARRRGGGVPGA